MGYKHIACLVHYIAHCTQIQEHCQVPDYYPSLEERRLSIFEGCAACGDDGGSSMDDTSGDMTGDDEDSSKLMNFLSKYKKKRKK